MNVLLLGGQSPRHYEWVRELQKSLEAHSHAVTVHDYAHWLCGDNDIDLEAEVAAVSEKASGLNDYVIVAKSIGSVVATLGNARGLLTPKACVFMGFPLSVVEAELDSQVSEALPVLPKTVLMQNANDPLGSAERVQQYISTYKSQDVEFVTLSGDTHDYMNFELANDWVMRLTT